jgi:hypothetical protein
MQREGPVDDDGMAARCFERSTPSLVIRQNRRLKNMHQKVDRFRAAVGFTVKSGWASAVLLAGPTAKPRLVDSCRVELSDPAIPESRQPYHATFGIARGQGPELSGLIASVKRFGGKSVGQVIRHYQAGYDLRGAGVVVGSLIDPARITNDHIRIHAREGQLFRRVVEDAAARSHLRCSIWRERDLYASAVGLLKRSERELREGVTALGADAEGSWRAEHKLAALAAWLVLAAGPGAKGRIRTKQRAA